MAKHSKAAGRTVRVAAARRRGAHRAAADHRAPLANRVSAILVAAGAAAVVVGFAHVASVRMSPLAAGVDNGGVADVDTVPVHPVDPGAEIGRLLRQQQAAAARNWEAVSEIARPQPTAAPVPTTRPVPKATSAGRREVEAWIVEAIGILSANGTSIDESSVDAIYTVVMKESGGNPNAVNRWDSNAAKGTPSKGLMQCIDRTFNTYKLPGHDNTFDPVDSIIAGVRYTYARYGGLHRHPGLVSLRLGGAYRGY